VRATFHPARCCGINTLDWRGKPFLVQLHFAAPRASRGLHGASKAQQPDGPTLLFYSAPHGDRLL